MLGVRTKGTRSPGAEGGKAKCTGGSGTCQEALKLQPPSLVPLQLSQAAEPMARHQAWKPGSQHAGEKRGVAGLLMGRVTESEMTE